MLSFITVALLVYGSMHLYAFGKIWAVLPHSFRLAFAPPEITLITIESERK
ncbi:MAG: hypothetical protein HY846_06475 [Nitrosomonadales bacterium]|nr:hypothetical protein [Nitrosomonadales bacterium]